MSQRPMDGEGDWGDPVPGDQPPPPGPVPGRPYPPPGQPAYSQPHGGSGAPPPHPGQGPQKVDNFLVPSILATIFCCLPTGIAAIVFAAQVNTKVAQGDYAGAQASAVW